MEGMSPETIAWLDRNPRWDPRVRLAGPEAREQMISERAAGILKYGGRAAGGGSAAATQNPAIGPNSGPTTIAPMIRIGESSMIPTEAIRQASTMNRR